MVTKGGRGQKPRPNDLAFLTSSDFEEYPILEIDRGSYKLNQVDAPRVDKEFWFLEGRKSWHNGQQTLAYHITKVKILYITRNTRNGTMAFDTYRYISGAWNRRVYEFKDIKGFGGTIHALFDSRESLGRYAMHQKLLGVNMVDLSEEDGFEDGFHEPLTIVRQIAYPVTGRSTELGMYLAHLAKELSWSYGAYLNVTSSTWAHQMLSANQELKLILVDSFMLDPTKGFVLEGNRPATKHRGSANQYEMNKDRNILIEWAKDGQFAKRLILRVQDHKETVPKVKDGSLDFVYVHSNLVSSREFNEYLELWLPKLKPNGWLVGTGIQRKHLHDIVVERFPNWEMGYHGSWLAQIAR